MHGKMHGFRQVMNGCNLRSRYDLTVAFGLRYVSLASLFPT